MFHKAAIMKALRGVIIPAMEERGGLVAEQCATIRESIENVDQTSREILASAVALRRGLNHMVQEFVMDKVTTVVFPEIDQRVKALNLVGPIATKVKTLVYDMAEDIVRGQIYENVVAAYDKIEQVMKVPGCDVEIETHPKKAVAEDEFGWLIAQGGWKRERQMRRGAGLGAGGPMEKVGAILDDIKETLEPLLGESTFTFQMYCDKALDAQQLWMETEGNALIAKAKKKGKDLESVKVPVSQFHKAGLNAALKALKKQLSEMGDPLKGYAEAMVIAGRETVVEYRRMADQLVQHLVMDKVQLLVFPELDARIADLDLPRGPVGGQIKKKAYDMLEEIVRKVIHKEFLSLFRTVNDK
eukprot:SAG31_NODE_1000_length_10456_cov_3.588394_6_plen_357_part_00